MIRTITMSICKNCNQSHPLGSTCESKSTVSCTDVKRCETVTSLSPFVVKGTEVCIEYKDEKGIVIKRCFDIQPILNNTLKDVDPRCIASKQDWDAMNFQQKFQAIINYNCPVEATTTTTTSTTTTTTSSTTTTTTTKACSVITDVIGEYKSSDSTIVLTKLTFQTEPNQSQIVTVKHRLQSEPDDDFSYVIDSVNTVVTSNGTFSPEFIIVNILSDQSYVVRVVTSCGTYYDKMFSTVPPTTTTTSTSTTSTTSTTTTSTTTSTTSTSSTTTTTTTTIRLKAWIEDSYTCEQEEVFTLQNEITVFSSPSKLLYDSSTGRMYVGDHDDPSGNVFYFNPATFTNSTQITRVGSLAGVYYTVEKDEQYKRLYFVGKNSGGLVSFDISTGTSQTVVFGTDGFDYNRIAISIQDNLIYCTDRYNNNVIIIDRASLIVNNTVSVSSIPSGETYFDDYFMTRVGNELWISSSFNTSPNIAVYDLNLTTLITTIDLATLGCAVETSSKYRGSAYYDKEKNKVYIFDNGSSKLFIIDGTTRNVVFIRDFQNREGKLYGGGNVVNDPITGDLFISFSAYSSVGDNTAIRRMYKVHRDNYSIEVMYPSQQVQQLVLQDGTTNVWGVFAGIRQWDNVTGYDTDGKILKYTR